LISVMSGGDRRMIYENGSALFRAAAAAADQSGLTILVRNAINQCGLDCLSLSIMLSTRTKVNRRLLLLLSGQMNESQ
jgi:hypothetical protein